MNSKLKEVLTLMPGIGCFIPSSPKPESSISRKDVLTLTGLAGMATLSAGCISQEEFQFTKGREEDIYPRKASIYDETGINGYTRQEIVELVQGADMFGGVSNQESARTEVAFAPEVSETKVNFLSKHPLIWGDKRRPVLMLTYDDFGDTKHFDAIIDAFEGRGLATFFISGDRLVQCQESIRKLIDRGHTFACHAWSHKETDAMTMLSNNTIRAHLEKFLDTSQQLFGDYKVEFLRAPFGAVDQRVINIAAEYGLQHVLWSGSSGGLDDLTHQRVTGNPKNGQIILSHIRRHYDYTGAQKIVDTLTEKGYSLETINTGRDPKDVYPESGLKPDFIIRDYLVQIFRQLLAG